MNPLLFLPAAAARGRGLRRALIALLDPDNLALVYEREQQRAVAEANLWRTIAEDAAAETTRLRLDLTFWRALATGRNFGRRRFSPSGFTRAVLTVAANDGGRHDRT